MLEAFEDISSGTLRSEDLLPAFADTLRKAIEKETAPEAFDAIAAILEARAVVDDLARLDRESVAPDDPDYIETHERAAEALEALRVELEERAPAFCYVGTYEGDGAAFAVLPSVDSFEQACIEGDAIKLEGVPDHIGIVSDHGNLTVYAVTVSEVWAVV